MSPDENVDKVYVDVEEETAEESSEEAKEEGTEGDADNKRADELDAAAEADKPE